MTNKKDTLFERIRGDQVQARKNRQSLAASLLTTLIGEAAIVAKNDQRQFPTDEETVAIVKKFLKGNVETQAIIHRAIEAQESHNPAYISHDMLNKLTAAQEEQKILESYLPRQLSQDELKRIVGTAIDQGAPRNVGALMGLLKKNHAGKYDGNTASSVIKSFL